MKKFLLTVLKFSCPLLLLSAFIFFTPVSRKYAYAFVNKGGCEGRSSWIYRNIYEDSNRIDVAFIGTSHTMNAVNDKLLEEQYKNPALEKIYFRNLAYCRLGRNFDYVIIRDLLQHKKTRTLVLEVRESESQLGHPSFAHIAGVADLVKAPIWFNRSYLPDLYKGLLLRLQYLRESATGEDVRHQVDISPSPFGFNGTDRIADSAELYPETNKKGFEIDFLEKQLNSYPLKYIERIEKLADENNTHLVFLYLPEFGHTEDTTKIRCMYEKFGEVIFPPTEILSDPSGWSDKGHLNNKSADKLSGWLAQKLGEEL